MEFRGQKKNDRRYTGGGRRPDRRALRQEEADERLNGPKGWAKLSPQEQLDALDLRLGKGVGADKQRKRLLAAIEEAKKPKAKTKDDKKVERTTKK